MYAKNVHSWDKIRTRKNFVRENDTQTSLPRRVGASVHMYVCACVHVYGCFYGLWSRKKGGNCLRSTSDCRQSCLDSSLISLTWGLQTIRT